MDNCDRLYDLSSLKEIDAGNPGAMAQILKIFSERTPQVIARMDKAIASFDGEELAFQAHILKASIDLLSITSLTAVIRQIEKTGKTGEGKEKLDEAVTTLKEKMEEVLAGLRNDFS